MEKKTKPVSIRFDERKLAYLMEQEGLNSKQKAVDYLLEKYWWECHIGIPPTNERNGGGPSIDRNHVKKSPKPNLPDIDLSKDPAFSKLKIGIEPNMSEEDATRIATLQAEIEKGPPKELSSIGKKSYLYDRNKEINEIKAKYGNE